VGEPSWLRVRELGRKVLLDRETLLEGVGTFAGCEKFGVTVARGESVIKIMRVFI
jgi:hypothetical protein